MAYHSWGREMSHGIDFRLYYDAFGVEKKNGPTFCCIESSENYRLNETRYTQEEMYWMMTQALRNHNALFHVFADPHNEDHHIVPDHIQWGSHPDAASPNRDWERPVGMHFVDTEHYVHLEGPGECHCELGQGEEDAALCQEHFWDVLGGKDAWRIANQEGWLSKQELEEPCLNVGVNIRFDLAHKTLPLRLKMGTMMIVDSSGPFLLATNVRSALHSHLSDMVLLYTPNPCRSDLTMLVEELTETILTSLSYALGHAADTKGTYRWKSRADHNPLQLPWTSRLTQS
jgi:hypothetical protein